MSTRTIELKKVMIMFRGDYDAQTEYNYADVVEYEGSSYALKVENATGKVPTNTDYWELLVEKPVKGVDYYTEEDKQEIISAVVDDATSEFNQNVTEKTAAFNENAVDKTSDFNDNASSKTTTFNNNYTSKKGSFDDNASSKTTAFNENATSKTTDFNSNASSKTDSFDSNASSKTTDFNTNATNKTTDFNSNATDKTTDFNSNYTTKLEDFNTNATNKTTAYNENAEEKVEEFNDNVDDLTERLERAELVYNAMPKLNATGANITLDDTAECPMKLDPQATGLEQETTTGKNLLPFAYLTSSSATDNRSNLSLEAGTYTLSLRSPNGALVSSSTWGGSYQLNLQSSDNSNVLVPSGANPVTFTITSEQASSITNCIFYDNIYESGQLIQLEKSSSVTDWEKFTGGSPAPSPSYPQDIHTISGDNKIINENKNLLDKNKIGIGYNTTVTQIENGVKIAGTNYAQIEIDVIPNTDYYLQYITTNITGSTKQIVVYKYDSNPTTSIKSFTNGTGGTFNSGNNTKILILFYVGLGSQGEVNFTNIQLEKGTTPTTYVEHKETSYRIDLAPNLFDISTVSIEYYIGGAGQLISSNYTNASDYIEVEGGKEYVITWDYETLSNNTAREIGIYNTSKTFIERITGVDVNTKIYKFTPQQNGYIRFDYDKNCYNVHFYKQESSLEVCEIGDYKDEFYKNSGKNLAREEFDTKWYFTGSGDNRTITDATQYKKAEVIEVEPNTDYYISGEFTTATLGDGNIRIGMFDSTPAVGSVSTKYVYSDTAFTFKTDTNTKYIVLFSVLAGDTTVPRLMLTKGTTYVEYEPYGDGKWYLKKNIGKRILDGSESGWGTSGSNYYLFFANKRSLTNYVPSAIKSNYFKAMPYSGGSPNIGYFLENYYTTGNQAIFFNYNGSSSDLDGFKTWLSTHNTEVYYVLATPTYILLNNTLQTELNNIEKALSKQGQTNINQANNDLPFTISAEAIYDINKLVTRVAELETE